MAAGPFVDPLATRLPSGKKVPHVWVEGGSVSTGATAPQAVIIDEAAAYTYFGYAVIGAAEGDAVWKISRLSTANPQKLTWADGNAEYDNVWTNRASLTYA